MTSVSIVIVSYNVRHFILQCLESVYACDLTNVQLKVYVVDNNSVDGSVQMIRHHYPQVNLIESDKNLGFGRANNLAINLSQSTYCLLLNPDTIIQKDTLQKCITFMNKNLDYGALGVQMVDGNGTYLPESKRSLPSPISALFKMLRLGDIFPNSALFNSYYTSDLSGNKDEDVEVLCGAFMFCKTKVLQNLGGFDEAFFMYGEDIDLSKRILESGYKIRYTADTRIIHFKGESSKKSSLNYIHSFYNAMIIYVEKHYPGNGAILIRFLLKTAIFLSGLMRAAREYIKASLRLFVDFICIYVLVNMTKDIWGKVYFQDSNYYDQSNFQTNALFYTLIWVTNLRFWGWYDSNRKLKSLFYANVIGTIMILAIYAILPLEYRSSRTLIFIGAIVALLVPIVVEKCINILSQTIYQSSSHTPKIIIVGHEKSKSKILDQLDKNNLTYQFIGLVNPNNSNASSSLYINTLSKLSEVVNVYKVDEIIFSMEDISADEIMQCMTIAENKVKYKIAGINNNQIIGNDDNNVQSQIIDTYSNYNLSKSVYKRLKRLFDLVISISLIVFIPLLLLSNTYRTNILPNIFNLLFGRLTLIGYSIHSETLNLPVVKPSLIQLNRALAPKEFLSIMYPDLNKWYAKNYTPFYDLEILKNSLLK